MIFICYNFRQRRDGYIVVESALDLDLDYASHGNKNHKTCHHCSNHCNHENVYHHHHHNNHDNYHSNVTECKNGCYYDSANNRCYHGYNSSSTACFHGCNQPSFCHEHSNSPNNYNYSNIQGAVAGCESRLGTRYYGNINNSAINKESLKDFCCYCCKARRKSGR